MIASHVIPVRCHIELDLSSVQWREIGLWINSWYYASEKQSSGISMNKVKNAVKDNQTANIVFMLDWILFF